LIAARVLFFIHDRLCRLRGGVIMRQFVARARKPVMLLFAALALLLVLPSARVAESTRNPIEHGIGLLALAAVGWLAVNATYIVEALVMQRYDIDVADNAVARRARTQTSVLRRVSIFVIVIVVTSAMLMTFARARALGASLLASAGILGIVVGFAARPTLGNVIAGLQIALTNSLSLEDAVIVEGEWGRVEEITLTYVVVRIWDERRLILPSEYFVSTPFQNWTRGGEGLIGTVMLEVDYEVPIAEVRAALDEAVKSVPEWDGRVAGVQMVDTSDGRVQLRVLVSAATSGATWNARCAVRESLVEFLRTNYPHSLPRSRVQLLDGMPMESGLMV
jgi:small-conductance mechanosensitive channel